MNDMEEMVIIRVKYKTREKLKDIGTKRETYNDIIERLIKKEVKK